MDLRDIAQVEEQIEVWIRAGTQCIQIAVGGAMASAEQSLAAMAKKLKYTIAVWDMVRGFNGQDKGINPVEALEMAINPTAFNEHTIIVMRDLHYELAQNPATVAALKNGVMRQAFNSKKQRRPIILLTPGAAMNPDIAPYMKQIDYPPPNLRQRLDIFDGVRASISDATKRQCSEELRLEIATAMAGLTASDASDALSESLVKHGGIRPEVLDTLEFEKARALKRSEVLTYIPRDQVLQVTDLGGWEEVKSWTEERRIAYSPEAADLGLDYPKGAVLLGVPGTAKSVGAGVIARILGLPLIKFKFDAVFNSLVGESEKMVRQAIHTATAMEGCVLVFDEADKAFAGADQSVGDSGVTTRVFGVILDWLAAKNDRTFPVFTMNRTNNVPPELLRRGRFDEIFFVDIPNEAERRSIFEIHMRKRRIDPASFTADEWHTLISKSKDYVGGEIESALSASRFAAYRASPASRAIPTAAQIVAALNNITPITQAYPDNIDAMRKLGEKQARPASGRAKRSDQSRLSRALDLDMPFGGSNN